ncbi:hypothetical protein [Methylomicrobium agile]|uniref:hypothetical protein n=1 Tax=Methylomicrobium agile TaxID=39774 RepID=UPI0014703F26|nr:hypothetical protein [Methylomicrobium agile]
MDEWKLSEFKRVKRERGNLAFIRIQRQSRQAPLDPKDEGHGAIAQRYFLVSIGIFLSCIAELNIGFFITSLFLYALQGMMTLSDEFQPIQNSIDYPLLRRAT